MAVTPAGTSLAAKGISHETIRQALIAKGVAPATAAAFPGIEHEVVRDALAAKAIGGVGAGTGIVAGKSALATTPAAQVLTTGGTLWSGKSLSLGLGMWGPVLAGIAGAAAVYSFLRYRQNQKTAAAALEQEEIADEGFLNT